MASESKGGEEGLILAHSLTVAEVLTHFGVTEERGLTSAQVTAAKEQWGTCGSFVALGAPLCGVCVFSPLFFRQKQRGETPPHGR
jgi:hypothetical protein